MAALEVVDKVGVFPVPSYLTKKKWKSETDRVRAYTRFYVRLAALYASEGGSLASLSKQIGFTTTRSIPGLLKTRTAIAPEVAVAIERVLGRHIMPREVLRPDLFDLDHRPHPKR